jgi:voltage-gated potassium channel
VILEREISTPNEVSKYPYFLAGDATLDELLLDAGIINASALITTLPADADNLFVVLTARELNPKLKIVSRATLTTSIKKLKSAGADNVIMPDKIGGAQMASLITKPDIKEFIDVLMTTDDVTMVEISVTEEYFSKPLEQFKLNYPNQTVLGLKDKLGGYVINPSNNLKLMPGMKLICLK